MVGVEDIYEGLLDAYRDELKRCRKKVKKIKIYKTKSGVFNALYIGNKLVWWRKGWFKDADMS